MVIKVNLNKSIEKANGTQEEATGAFYKKRHLFAMPVKKPDDMTETFMITRSAILFVYSSCHNAESQQVRETLETR